MGAVKKIGNSLWVLLPAALAKAAGLQEGSAISISANEAGDIRIKKKMSAIEALAVSASVSYAHPPSTKDIERMIVSGRISKEYLPHMAHILNEAPSSLWVEAARQLGEPKIVTNVVRLREAVNAS